MMRAALALTAATTAVAGFGPPADRALPAAPVAAVRAPAAPAGDAAEVAPRRSVSQAGPRAAARPVSWPAARPAPPAGARRERVWWDGRPFATPEAAMRFLVRAYNAHDDAALRHVTTPDARADLLAMRAEVAPELRLRSCTRLESGAYDCDFWHSPAEGSHRDGSATFRVAPAARPGWYLTVLEGCG